MKKTKLFRIALPALLIIAWFAVSGFGGPTFGKISDVSSNDQATFLPASADSTKVQALQQKFSDSKSIPAIVVVKTPGKLAPADRTVYAAVAQDMSKVGGLQAAPKGDGLVVGPIPSKDMQAVEYIVPITKTNDLKTVVGNLRDAAAMHLPKGASVYVTGPAGLSADLISAFGGIDGLLLLVAVVAVFVILVVVYRSVLLPFIVLMTSLFALCAAILVVYLLAKYDIIQLNGQSQGILSILVIGAATDYSLLIVSRYREALQRGLMKWDAVIAALKGSIEPVGASAATVILALLCLLFSDLNSNRSLGPIAATGIVFAFLAAMTLLPALLVAFGKAAFWPSKVVAVKTKRQPRITTGKEELRGFWLAVAKLISARPLLTWTVTALVLLVAALGVYQLNANGVPQTDLILSKSDAVDGQAVLSQHFPGGSGTPIVVIADAKRVDKVVSLLQHEAGIAQAVTFNGSFQPGIPLPPKIVDGKVLINATLKSDPYSEQAESVVRTLRHDLPKADPSALVGGTTALNVDTTDTAKRDLVTIVPIVLAVILVVLMLLLRSVAAPLLLIGTVVLSFGATLGISALVFNHIFHFPGADPSVPLFGFVFLVALGVDYNIFLMTRAREEALKYGTRPAILHSLGKTGGVITSAGIVLAATFAALGVIPILFLAQIAFIVAFGVLLDTLLVRSLLVPALVYDFNERTWWPSRRLS